MADDNGSEVVFMFSLRSLIISLSVLSVVSAARAEPPAEPDVLPIGVDLAPYVGTSSASPEARRVVSINLVGGLSGGLEAFGLSAGFELVLGDMKGVSIAGGLSLVTGSVRGLQLAPINFAGGAVKGLQLGVINLAPRASAGIGVINIYWDGWVEGDVAVTDQGLALVGVRHGSDTLYNVYYAGTSLGDPSDVSFGIGLGARWLFDHGLELDLDATFVTTALDGRYRNARTTFSVRPQLAWRFVDHLALWASPTFNVATDDGDVSAGFAGGLRVF